MGTAVDALSPLRDTSRRRRILKIVAWLGSFALLVLVLQLLGAGIVGWLDDLWDQITVISSGYVVGGVVLQIIQTTANGIAYYGILSYGYPDSRVGVWPIVTAHAVGVAMNSFLPATSGRSSRY